MLLLYLLCLFLFRVLEMMCRRVEPLAFLLVVTVLAITHKQLLPWRGVAPKKASKNKRFRLVWLYSLDYEFSSFKEQWVDIVDDL